MSVTAELLQTKINLARSKGYDVDSMFDQLKENWHLTDADWDFNNTQKFILCSRLADDCSQFTVAKEAAWERKKTVTEQCSKGIFKVLGYIYNEGKKEDEHIKVKWNNMPEVCEKLGFYHKKKDQEMIELLKILKEKRSNLTFQKDESGQCSGDIRFSNLTEAEMQILEDFLNERDELSN